MKGLRKVDCFSWWGGGGGGGAKLMFFEHPHG